MTRCRALLKYVGALCEVGKHVGEDKSDAVAERRGHHMTSNEIRGNRHVHRGGNQAEADKKGKLPREALH